MVCRIYPSELQLNKASTEATFLDVHLSISNDIVSNKIIKNVTILILNCRFAFLDGDIPRSTSYGVYISRLLRFARASSNIALSLFYLLFIS